MWAAADKLRGNMDAAEYKHVVLGLIFLKYISDAFEEHHAKLKNELGADPEDRDEYTAANIFWVPKEARWSHTRSTAKQPEIGRNIDDASGRGGIASQATARHTFFLETNKRRRKPCYRPGPVLGGTESQDTGGLALQKLLQHEIDGRE